MIVVDTEKIILLSACNVGDEGGFAPNILDNKEGKPFH